jgi:predicted nucleic acid-binding protein
MEFHRVHYLDACVLVKLVVQEEPVAVTKRIENYMKAEYTSAFHATSLCFVEALGVLKLKYVAHNRPDHIDQETYLTAVDLLRGLVTDDGPVELVDVAIADEAVSLEVERIARDYALDVSDAYQIVTVRNDYWSRYRETKPILVTADAALAQAAQAEGLRVWDCLREPAPPGT